MEKIKKTIEEFSKAEAEASLLDIKPNIEDYNIAYHKMHEYTVNALTGHMGLIKKDELDEDDFDEFEANEWVTSISPRHLFKISQYKHSKYNDVWIAYVSETNPDADYKVMSYAFFIIKEEGKYLIAKEYIYSDYKSDGYEHTWTELSGYNDLRFDLLGEFVKTERYLEPEDDEISMKMYFEDK